MPRDMSSSDFRTAAKALLESEIAAHAAACDAMKGAAYVTYGYSRRIALAAAAAHCGSLAVFLAVSEAASIDFRELFELTLRVDTAWWDD